MWKQNQGNQCQTPGVKLNKNWNKLGKRDETGRNRKTGRQKKTFFSSKKPDVTEKNRKKQIETVLSVYHDTMVLGRSTIVL